MKLAVLTRSTSLFKLICQSFEADRATCSQFSDDVSLVRALYRDDFSAVLIDANTGDNPLRPLFARSACLAVRCTPLIVIGAPDDHGQIGQLLDAGADDIVLAPVNARELTLRVHCALRRVQPLVARDADLRLKCGAYVLDRRSGTVSIEAEPVKLTTREFAVTWLLFSHAGEYVSRRQIAGAVWSNSEDIAGRTLEQHVYMLRKKLRLSGQHGARLQTMYAYGYRIEVARATDVKEPDEASTAATTAIAVGLAAVPTSPATVPCSKTEPLQLTSLSTAHVLPGKFVTASYGSNGPSGPNGPVAQAALSGSAETHGALRTVLHVANSACARDARRWPDADRNDAIGDGAGCIDPVACMRTHTL